MRYQKLYLIVTLGLLSFTGRAGLGGEDEAAVINPPEVFALGTLDCGQEIAHPNRFDVRGLRPGHPLKIALDRWPKKPEVAKHRGEAMVATTAHLIVVAQGKTARFYRRSDGLFLFGQNFQEKIGGVVGTEKDHIFFLLPETREITQYLYILGVNSLSLARRINLESLALPPTAFAVSEQRVPGSSLAQYFVIAGANPHIVGATYFEDDFRDSISDLDSFKCPGNNFDYAPYTSFAIAPRPLHKDGTRKTWLAYVAVNGELGTIIWRPGNGKADRFTVEWTHLLRRTIDSLTVVSQIEDKYDDLVTYAVGAVGDQVMGFYTSEWGTMNVVTEFKNLPASVLSVGLSGAPSPSTEQRVIATSVNGYQFIMAGPNTLKPAPLVTFYSR